MGWVQSLRLQNKAKTLKKAKKRDNLMQGCTHLSRFALVSRVFSDRYAKKYTGYCIIACVPMWRRERDSNPCPACTGYRISSADPSTTWVSLQLLCYYNQSEGKNQGLPKDILLSASLALFAAFRLILLLPNAPQSYRHPLHQRSG